MKIVEIKALGNGGHRNQSGDIKSVPDGWAVIPDGVKTPNFPFGNVETEEIDGVMTVTKWEAGEIPEAEEEKPVSKTERLIEMLYKAGKLTEEEYNEIIKE